MERITVTGNGGFSSAGHPDYPYAQKAPYNEIWVTVSETAPYSGEDGLTFEKPSVYGTLGEYIDLNIEASEMAREEVTEILKGIEQGGEYLLPGFVGTGFLLERIEGPEAVLGQTAPTI